MHRVMMMVVAYDGTEFHGWQNQTDLRTVQDVLEQAVRRAVRHQVQITGSGRTDAGVHALGHVDAFPTTCVMDERRLQHAIGARLPKDVSLVSLREVHPDFHATRSALSKLYRYRVYNSTHRPVEDLLQRYTYHFWNPLDVDAMRDAARHFVGEKDFTSMAGAGAPRLSMVRRILRCDVERVDREVRIDVEGDGFLYKQVRNMVGTLLNVGRGTWPPERVPEILAARDRSQGGPTCPARGLTLQWVRYPDALLAPPPKDAAQGSLPRPSPAIPQAATIPHLAAIPCEPCDATDLE